ncbi:hypothetical protein [Microbacterium sp. PM5]|uniref:hypothetical protein n=1 Tax=Microbacterium sp. PM5 TaxID=2014534 RepID=UPI0019552082|nr:hypothetical protein [Microbacterium sp. PM5]
MPETPDIKITIDQDALREQVAEPIRTVMREAAMQLRLAADDLDGGAWWREHQALVDAEIAKARAEGRAESGDPS